MSSFLAKMAPKAKPAKGKGATAAQGAGRPRHMQIVATSYTSKPVKMAPNFLITTPHDAQPILTYPVDFTKTPLPEYRGLYAVVLDNVLSASECKQLIAYAEESAGAGEVENDKENAEDSAEVENRGWRPALVNAGPGREVLMTDYRNSDRIIWDNQEVMNRLWARCLLGDGIEEQLGRIEHKPLIQGVNAAERGDKWHFSRLNERMRFLKYGPGQFFKEHCDGSFSTPGRDGDEQSFITLHLYLNDSLQAITPVDPANASATPTAFPPPLANPDASPSSDEILQGGATTFHSPDMKRRLDVDPKIGRVLLFQHKGLLHSGDYVTGGIKYTMRTDLMYEYESYE